jgi:hypothetical protein
MKKFLSIALCLMSAFIYGQGRIAFEQYFEDRTLRIDYYHTGDAGDEEISLDKLYLQGTWAGNPDNCIQPFELGIYTVKVFDIATNRLIFSKGYSSIFAEYQTTDPAIKGIKRTYHESVLIPCPRKPFMLVLEKRDRYNLPSPIYRQTIDPADYHIIHESVASKTDQVIPVVKNGSPHRKVDLVILSEGYRTDELKTFKKDLEYYKDLFFSVEPYKSQAGLFNLHGVFSASEKAGPMSHDRIYSKIPDSTVPLMLLISTVIAWPRIIKYPRCSSQCAL